MVRCYIHTKEHSCLICENGVTLSAYPKPLLKNIHSYTVFNVRGYLYLDFTGLYLIRFDLIRYVLNRLAKIIPV